MNNQELTESIAALINLIKETDVTEVEASCQEGSIRIKRQEYNAPIMVNTAVAQPAPQPVIPMEAPPSPPPESAKISGKTMCSPMVGTIYLSPSPGAEAFVKIGQRVQIGDTLCLIEAMKMFNKIESELNGVVTAYLVENGQPVEFGQPLFMIEEA
jgi:acetyl-CoA carboxylase biotin carboxyl carrier protein